jgi:anti-anti-sigma regulatory factor
VTGVPHASRGRAGGLSRRHDDVLRITKSGYLPGLIVAGEIDESTYPCLVQNLAAVARHGDVHIDLGEVEFCDLAGLRAIVTLACSPGGDPARRVTLHAAPRRVRRILQILGWDVMPGVAFDDRRIPAAAAGRQHACH